MSKALEHGKTSARTAILCLLLIAVIGGQPSAANPRPPTGKQTEHADHVASKPDSSLMVDKVTAPREIGPQPEGVPAPGASRDSWPIALLGLAMAVVMGYVLRHTAQPTTRATLAAG